MNTIKRTKNKKVKIETIKCPHCGRKFGVDKDYIGIITCPYCGNYIEG